MRSSNQVSVDLEAFREFMKKADLDEKQRRLLYGFLAGEMDYGGIRAVSQAFAVSHVTVRKGRSEIAALAVKNTEDGTAGHIREPGGGRKSVVEKHPELLDALEALMRADASPGREPLLDWTTLSLRTVEKRFAGLGFYVTANTIGNTLRRLGFAMDGNRRMLPTPEARPDADEQFRFIRKKAERFLARKDPVISLGFKAPGDDVTGLSSLSVAPGARQDDTARLAECVERWWEAVGRGIYGRHRKLYVVMGAGGVPGFDVRAWRSALAALADRTGLEIHVSYVPAGTWRWNRIAHRWICREETEGAGRKEPDELVLSLIGDGEVEEDRVIVYPDVPAWKSACGRGAGGAKGKNTAKAVPDVEPLELFAGRNVVVRGWKAEA